MKSSKLVWVLCAVCALCASLCAYSAQAEIRVQNGPSYSGRTTYYRSYTRSYTYNPYAQGNSGYGYNGYNPYTGQLGQSGYYPPQGMYQYPVYPTYQPSFYNGNSMYYVPYGAYGR